MLCGWAMLCDSLRTGHLKVKLSSYGPSVFVSGKATNTLGPYDDNFTFRWPVLNESQSMAHPQSMRQGLRQMPPALKHGNVQNSTPNATISDFTPDPSEAFHESQAVGETRAASFGRIRNETNSVRLTG